MVVHNDRHLGTLNWRGQNAEKGMHIKGRLLDQAMILFNYVPFQNENFSKSKKCSQREQIFSFKSCPSWCDTPLLPHWVTSLECYYFITQVRNCKMGATPMHWIAVKLKLIAGADPGFLEKGFIYILTGKKNRYMQNCRLIKISDSS